MSGVQEYNDMYKSQSEKTIEENKDIKYLEDFYISMNGNGYATKYQYLKRVITFARFIGNKDSKDINILDYTKFLSSLSSKSAAYQKQAYAALKKLSVFFGEYGLGKDCVTAKIKTRKKESAETIKRRENGFLTQDEIDVLIQHVKDTNLNPVWRQRDVALFSVFRASGNRRAAIQKLDLNDINFKEGTIEVTEKGDNRRIIYLDSDTLHELESWIQYRSKISPQTNAVFVSNRLKRMNLGTFNQIFKRYGDIFPDMNLSPHKLRASYGTTMYNETHDLFFVQKAMGHSNPSITEIYIRGQENATKEARDILMRRKRERK